jgi:hypothetical protein
VRTRAKVAEEIAALAAEVSALVHTRGVGLPDVKTVVEFILAAFEYDRVHQVGEAVDARGYGALGEEISKLQVAPAAEELKTCVITVWEANGRDDLAGFRRASQSLREALLILLEARARKWRHLEAARELYPPSWQSRADPAEHVRLRVPGLTRWEVLVWAGRALACAVEDVWLWRLWQTGWREHQEDSRQRGQTSMSEQMWQREIVQHTLPENEARVVDSWPVPPDAEWPEGNEKSRLPQIRTWQSKQAALEGAPDTTAEGSSAQ